jgi:hypothetical protein
MPVGEMTQEDREEYLRQWLEDRRKRWPSEDEDYAAAMRQRRPGRAM